jgi:hypothetical protein
MSKRVGSMKHRTIANAAAVLAMMVAALAGGQAWAFGTINKAGQSSEHERITRLGMASAGFGSATLDSLAGKSGTFGAVGSPDNPARGLLLEDRAHCDNGDFLDVPGYPQSKAVAEQKIQACKAWIAQFMASAVTEAGKLVNADFTINTSEIPTLVACRYTGTSGRAKCNVLENFGVALHAAQDFYSHSNWVDTPAPGTVNEMNPPGLGNTGRSPWLDLRTNATVPIPDGLITGCFDEAQFPLVKKLDRSCLYGAHVHRAMHEVLNKDLGQIDVASGATSAPTTTRGQADDNFAKAVGAAAAETTDKWQYLTEQILATYGEERGGKIICTIRADDPATCQ